MTYAESVDCRKLRSESADLHWEKLGRNWTRERLITEIHRMNAAGESLRHTAVPPNCRGAAKRFFGSWRRAVQAVGIDYDGFLRRWTRKKVVMAIQKLADARVPLNQTYALQHHSDLAQAARKQFGSWGRALRAAGFDPAAHKKPKGPWDKPKALRWVLDRFESRESLLARDVPQDLKGFVWQTLKIGWAEFVESAGIPYPGIKKRQNFWTSEKVLEEIRRWHAEGHPMHYRGVRRAYMALIHQAKKYFRTWAAARAAAGV